jgi:acetolactate synthase I/II/III large subunit
VTPAAGSIAEDAARALAAARRHPGQVATLITPADCTWHNCDGPTAVPPPAPTPRVEEAAVVDAACALRSGEPAKIRDENTGRNTGRSVL